MGEGKSRPCYTIMAETEAGEYFKKSSLTVLWRIGCHGAKREEMEAKSLFRKYCSHASERRWCTDPWSGSQNGDRYTTEHILKLELAEPVDGLDLRQRKRQTLTLIAEVWGLKNYPSAIYWEGRDMRRFRFSCFLGWRGAVTKECETSILCLEVSGNIKEKIHILPIGMNFLMYFIFIIYYSFMSLFSRPWTLWRDGHCLIHFDMTYNAHSSLISVCEREKVGDLISWVSEVKSWVFWVGGEIILNLWRRSGILCYSFLETNLAQ